MKRQMISLFQHKEMTFLETANSKPNCKQQTATASIFAHLIPQVAHLLGKVQVRIQDLVKGGPSF